uniref:SGNH hydrolase-type esterase domain-containing protein n=1 Tax=Aureoumbra lagunensis TaxID=44058 RepID=A0A6S8C7X9_9STRA
MTNLFRIIGTLICFLRAKGSIIIACLGDSITFGDGDKAGYLSYPTNLRICLDNDGIDVQNFGRSGASIVPGPKEYRVYYDDVYLSALNSGADVFIIQFGTNDALPSLWNESQFRLSMDELIDSLENLPQQPTVVLGVPPPYVIEDDKLGPPEKNPVNFEVPQVIRNIAALRGLVYTDNFESFGGFITWNEDFYNSDDGIHPNAAGYNVISMNYYQTLADIWPTSFGFELTQQCTTGFLTTNLGLDNDGTKTGGGSNAERVLVEFVRQSDDTYKIIAVWTAMYLEMLGGSNYGKMILTSEGSNFYVVSSGLASGGYHLWLDFDDYDNGDFEGGAFNHYVRADNFFPVSSHNTGNTIVANFHGVSGTDDPRLEYFLFDSASGGNTLTITENDLGRSSSLPPYP